MIHKGVKLKVNEILKDTQIIAVKKGTDTSFLGFRVTHDTFVMNLNTFCKSTYLLFDFDTALDKQFENVLERINIDLAKIKK